MCNKTWCGHVVNSVWCCHWCCCGWHCIRIAGGCLRVNLNKSFVRGKLELKFLSRTANTQKAHLWCVSSCGWLEYSAVEIAWNKRNRHIAYHRYGSFCDWLKWPVDWRTCHMCHIYTVWDRCVSAHGCVVYLVVGIVFCIHCTDTVWPVLQLAVSCSYQYKGFLLWIDFDSLPFDFEPISNCDDLIYYPADNSTMRLGYSIL